MVLTIDGGSLAYYQNKAKSAAQKKVAAGYINNDVAKKAAERAKAATTNVTSARTTQDYRETGLPVGGLSANVAAVLGDTTAPATTTASKKSSSSRSSGGGGGSGGGSSAAATAAAALPSINDYINNSYLLKSVDDENDRDLADFDAVTKQQQDTTAADQAKRRVLLQQDLDSAGQDNAESFASRGLGRSGLVFQGQDKIDKQGEAQSDSINQLMTQLLQQRAADRLTQLSTNRTNRQNAINQLTQQYNTLLGTGTTAAS